MTDPNRWHGYAVAPTATLRALGYTVPTAQGYGPPPIGAAPSYVTGRPSIAVTEFFAINSPRPGQAGLTVVPVGYVPSVTTVGTATSSGGAGVKSVSSSIGTGGLSLPLIVLGLVLLGVVVYAASR